jgi:hypothetical protein
VLIISAIALILTGLVLFVRGLLQRRPRSLISN